MNSNANSTGKRFRRDIRFPNVDVIKKIRHIFYSYRDNQYSIEDNDILIKDLIKQAAQDGYNCYDFRPIHNTILLKDAWEDYYLLFSYHYSTSRSSASPQNLVFNLQKSINIVSEHVDAITMMIYGNLQIDNIYYMRQGHNNHKNTIMDIASLSAREFQKMPYHRGLGVRSIKLSPAYYWGEETSDAIFIKELALKNYKFFAEEQMYNFRDRFTVLIGNNSSGKTSLIDAIRASMLSLLSNMGNKRRYNVEVVLNNSSLVQRINKAEKVDLGLAKIISLSDVHQNIQDCMTPKECQCYVRSTNDWLEWTHEKKEHHNRFRRSKSEQAIDYATDLYELSTSNYNNQITLPMFAYYGIHRTYEKHGKAPRLTSRHIDGYANCMDAQTSYTYFKYWFANYDSQSHTLKCFKDTILKCLSSENIVDINYKKEIEVDGKTIEFNDFVLTRRVNNTEEHILMKNLSAGYKIICSMVADMAYRCLQLNEPIDENDNPITRTPGLVLIDEIDMHLHPLWQRHVVADLMRCFPKLQFITTTHSPFIVQSLTWRQLISLSPQDRISDADPISQNIEFVINEMGVDSPHGERYNTQREIAVQFYNLLSRGNYSEEEFENIYKQYQLKYGDDTLFIERMKKEKEWKEIYEASKKRKTV